MTIKALRQYLFSLLQQEFAAETYDEVAAIFTVVGNIKEAEVLAHGEKRLDPQVEKRIIDAARRRLQHEPLAQISGFACFYGRKFLVSPEVLIPRADTEVLVEKLLEVVKGREPLTVEKEPMLLPEMKDCNSLARAKERKPPTKAKQYLRILDSCTGTGAIGITLALELLSCGFSPELCLVDISPFCTDLAAQNAKRLLPCPLSVAVRTSDLWPDAAISEGAAPFDLITINPPYIKSAEIRELMPEVSHYEPFLALSGGFDGLDFYRRIAVEVIPYLAHGGLLLLEHGNLQQNEIIAIMKQNGFCVVRRIHDYGGNPRGVIFTRSLPAGANNL